MHDEKLANMEESEMNIKGIKVPTLKNKFDLPPHTKLDFFVKKVSADKRAIYDDDSDNDDGKGGAAGAKKGVQSKKPKK